MECIENLVVWPKEFICTEGILCMHRFPIEAETACQKWGGGGGGGGAWCS